MPDSQSFPTKTRFARFWILLLGGVIALAALAVTLRGRGHTHRGILADLEHAHPVRAFSPRLSIGQEYHRCTAVPTKPDETVPREACGQDDGRLDDLGDLSAASQSANPDSLRASALLLMLRGDTTEPALDTAVARLTRALPLSPRPASIAVDLSGAHLARAQRTQNAHDLMLGLDYALLALADDSTDVAARFNRALALQMLGLDDQATLAWAAYLRTDSTSDWAREAQERRRTLRHPPRVQNPAASASADEVRAFATAHPQEARLYGWDIVLGRWGNAHLAGHAAEAAAELQLAERLGAALESRPGGDASLADAVRAIRAKQNDSTAIRALARAHSLYAAGQVLLGGLDYPAAADSFAQAANARTYSPVLGLAARAAVIGAAIASDRFQEVEQSLQLVISEVDSVRYPAIAARVRWMRGTGTLRHGQYAVARELMEASARLFERAGETEYIGTTWQIAGEAACNSRDADEAYRLIQRGLMSLRHYRSSVWLSNTLWVLANCATVDEMSRSAALVQNENVGVAIHSDQPVIAVEALLGRASLRAIEGRRSDAARDLELANRFIEKVGTAEAAKVMREKAHYSQALLATDTTAVTAIDSAVAHFDSINNAILLLPALLRRADVHLERGELTLAASDLDTATARIRRLSDSLQHVSLRMAMMEQARSRIDQLVMLHLRAGDSIAALQALERGRVSFTPGYEAAALPAGRPRMPVGEVGVEYALIDNTLLTWIIRGGDVRLLRNTVPRGEMLRRIERVMMESPSRADAAGPDLEWLYDVLMRPVQRQLQPGDTSLVIVADGEVAGVPFEALRDARRDRYVVEDHTLRFAATLADAARPAPADGPTRPALLVADPAYDSTQYRTLDRLRSAQAEVDSIAPLYPGGTVLRGDGATRDAFLREAPRAGVLHYAGHALFDDARPERSALVLAGADTTGRLTAGAVSGLHLQGVRLVVLAACSTLRARQGRAGGLAGFSGALLAAGAGGVVGSLWEADDRTTQPLMLAFHRAYAESHNPASALRQAQLAMLHSSVRAQRSPATWAGFRYIGR